MTFLTGDKELDRNLRRASGLIQKRVMTKAIRAGLGEVRNAIKSEVKPASVKRSIASKFKRRKGGDRGYRAVAGGGVGKRNKGKAPTRGGVGISKNNVHWYLMGTAQRSTKSGSNRGRMPGVAAVVRGFAKSGTKAIAKIQAKARTELQKELAKLKT